MMNFANSQFDIHAAIAAEEHQFIKQNNNY